MNKIQKVSRFFKVLFEISFVVTPLLNIISWFSLKANGYAFLSDHGLELTRLGSSISPIPETYISMLNQPSFDHLPFTLLQKLACFGLNLFPLAVQMLILYFLIRLFKLYEQGEIFSLNSVHYIRNIGYLLLIGQFVNLLYEALLGLLLSLQHGNGHGMFGITYNDSSSTLLIGLMVILISWIMAEGCKLREEQQLTI